MNLPPDLDLWAMLLLGLSGTGHCLGMCGPLVIAIPGRMGAWSAHGAYHAGRLITYTAGGAILGLFSSGMMGLAGTRHMDPMVWVARSQVLLSVVATVMLLILGLHRLGLLGEPRWLSEAMPQKIPGVGPAIRRAMGRNSLGSIFALGLMLGLLPCGLSYAAFARTLASGSPLAGAGLALVFGIGTLPGLLLLGTGAAAVWKRYRQQSEIIAGLIMIGMAAALIARMWSGG